MRLQDGRPACVVCIKLHTHTRRNARCKFKRKVFRGKNSFDIIGGIARAVISPRGNNGQHEYYIQESLIYRRGFRRLAAVSTDKKFPFYRLLSCTSLLS